MNYREKINYIRLSRSENVGPKTFMNLMSLYKSIDDAIIAAPELAAFGGRIIKVMSYSAAEKEYEKTKNLGGDIIIYKEQSYSKLLREIDDPPPVITVMGDLKLFNDDNNIAIVGSRNFSTNGYHFTKKISKDLVENDFLITSGLARGIDSAAHISALDSKTSATIAVIAGGIDNIYPPENRELYNRIKENGLIIAEMPFGTVPKSQNFPRRNRIISGITKAVIVIEASLKSGSLITARFAVEQNREVFVVPGFPLDQRYEGNNKLIKDGATLITSAKDVIESIYKNQLSDHSNYYRKDIIYEPVDENILNDARKIIVNSIGSAPTCIDLIFKETGFPIQVILTVILELELAGRLERHFGNNVSMIYN